jgi:limonene-1,2-epoxide hydrolase
MATSGEIVRSYVRAIGTKDMKNAIPYLWDDAVFDNVPMDPPAKLTVGPAAIQLRLQMLLDACVKVEWEIVRQIEQGDTVFNERVDRFWFKPGLFPKGDLLEWPACTRWELEAGKIKLWRDYYELHLTEAQLGVSLEQFGTIIGNNYGT